VPIRTFTTYIVWAGRDCLDDVSAGAFAVSMSVRTAMRALSCRSPGRRRLSGFRAAAVIGPQAVWADPPDVVFAQSARTVEACDHGEGLTAVSDPGRLARTADVRRKAPLLGSSVNRSARAMGSNQSISGP
jgi:hypothetical protein